jgi:hypothetical protein
MVTTKKDQVGLRLMSRPIPRLGYFRRLAACQGLPSVMSGSRARARSPPPRRANPVNRQSGPRGSPHDTGLALPASPGQHQDPPEQKIGIGHGHYKQYNYAREAQ